MWNGVSLRNGWHLRNSGYLRDGLPLRNGQYLRNSGYLWNGGHRWSGHLRNGQYLRNSVHLWSGGYRRSGYMRKRTDLVSLVDEFWRQPPGDVEGHLVRVGVWEPQLPAHVVMHSWTGKLANKIAANENDIYIYIIRADTIQSSHIARNARETLLKPAPVGPYRDGFDHISQLNNRRHLGGWGHNPVA